MLGVTNDDLSVSEFARAVAGITTDEMIRHMAGRELKEIFPPRNARVGEMKLRVTNLTRTPKFENICFEARAGEVVGIAGLAGAALPRNPIDGRNVWDVIGGKRGAANPHDYYAFSTGPVFEGVISGDGRWKLHLPHSYRTLVTAGQDGAAGKYRQEKIELSLFDMERDPMESVNVIDKYPQVAAKLQRFAEQHKSEFYSDQRSALG